MPLLVPCCPPCDLIHWRSSNRAQGGCLYRYGLSSCLQELRTFLTIYAETTVVIDQSPNGDLLRINFNISFPALSCEFASVDVNDVLGTVSPRTRCDYYFQPLPLALYRICLAAWPPTSNDKQKYVQCHRGYLDLLVCQRPSSC